ncbi:MAG: hypothetical protein OER43_03805 [Gammaproteobacteria bacterium]|nr:hypothetical protein [Gammaproteobacteria bacterium]MDH3411193.1 hypothetical protein [Gammaproteobacteria bacterium]
MNLETLGRTDSARSDEARSNLLAIDRRITGADAGSHGLPAPHA